MHRRLLLSLVPAALLALAAAPARAEETSSLADELKLKSVGLATDGEGLLHFFRSRAKGEAPGEKIKELMEKLDDKSEATRQKACAELVAIGPPAIPLLRVAAKEIDNPDLASLARRCLHALEGDSANVTSAAVRLVAQRRPAGTAKALLDYLPHAENEAVMDEVRAALTGVAYVKGEPEKVVVAALADKHPLRRATAIQALCSGGIAEPRETLRKLLDDPKASVRLRAGLALAGASDAKAVSTIISLMADLPVEQAREVESFLGDLARDQGPKVVMGDEKASREKARDAWAKWWIETEGPGLLEEVTKRTLSEKELEEVGALIDKLGDDDFDTRQNAEAELKKKGSKIVPLLKVALKNPDLEIRNRARKALDAIEKDKTPPLSPVTCRLIALRKPANAVEALLLYIPFADDDSLAEEIQTALNAIAYPKGKAHPFVVKMLGDKYAARRAAAAQALAFGGPVTPHLKEIKKLLKDKDQTVRLKVALALASGAREADAVPVLIKLIGDLPADQASQAEEYLVKLARDRMPKLPEGDDSRVKRSEAWQKWWDDNKKTVVMVDRFEPTARVPYLGYTLLIQTSNNQIVELGKDDKPRWTLTGLLSPYDAQVLPGNRLLVAEYNGMRVSERDMKGNVLWEKRVSSYPIMAERLKSGNTFIVCNNMMVEVDKGGREVLNIPRPTSDVYAARKLPSGDIVVYNGNSRTVQRLDRTGKEKSSFMVPIAVYQGTEILDNGHVLMPINYQNKVVEYDTKGKEVLTISSVMRPMHAHRAANGHTVVTSQQFPYKVYEFDRKGKQVKELPMTTYTFRAKKR